MKLAVMVSGILLFLSLNSFAAEVTWHGWRGSRGWGMESSYQKQYDPKGVVMVSGVVTSIEQIVPIKGISPGIAIKIKTEAETLSVHLGPIWYVERLDYKISEGDKLEVKGVRTLFNAKPAVIASEIRNGNRFLILRDNMGVPVWSGWGWKK